MVEAVRRRLWSKVAAAAAGLPRAVRYLAGDLLAGLAALCVIALVIVVAALSLIGVGLLLVGVAAAAVPPGAIATAGERDGSSAG